MIFYYSLITVPTLVTLHSFTIMKHLKIFIYIIFFLGGVGVGGSGVILSKLGFMNYWSCIVLIV